MIHVQASRARGKALTAPIPHHGILATHTHDQHVVPCVATKQLPQQRHIPRHVMHATEVRQQGSPPAYVWGSRGHGWVPSRGCSLSTGQWLLQGVIPGSRHVHMSQCAPSSIAQVVADMGACCTRHHQGQHVCAAPPPEAAVGQHCTAGNAEVTTTSLCLPYVLYTGPVGAQQQARLPWPMHKCWSTSTLLALFIPVIAVKAELLSRSTLAANPQPSLVHSRHWHMMIRLLVGRCSSATYWADEPPYRQRRAAATPHLSLQPHSAPAGALARPCCRLP